MPRYIKYVFGGFAHAFGSSRDLYPMEKKGEIAKRVNRKIEKNQNVKEKELTAKIRQFTANPYAEQY